MDGVLTITETFQQNQKETTLTIIFITGILGSGKTTFLKNLLQWMRARGMKRPPVIVNDRGEGANLDYAAVTSGEQGIEAWDLLGQCIGCGGREQFIEIVQRLQDQGKQMLFVEPTGLFTLDELERLAQELQGCPIRSIHLLPVAEIQTATTVGLSNLRICRVIGLTHARRDVTKQTRFLRRAMDKPVVIVEEVPDNKQLNEIWGHLTTDHEEPVSTGEHQGCSHGCSHGDHDGHSHDHHHHEDHVYTTSFSTKGWTVAELIGYLLTLNSLVRFKGVVQEGEQRVQIDWAHGSWSQRVVSNDLLLKADLFTQKRIDPPSCVAMTDKMIGELIKGIPPVLVESPMGGYAMLDAVGPTAWSLLYTLSKQASDEVRKACGMKLTGRCHMAAAYLVNTDLSLLDPKMLDYTRLQTAMVWLWWNQEFDIDLSGGDHMLINTLLEQLDPEGVDLDALRPWMGESYAYLPRLCDQFPAYRVKIARVAERHAAG